MIEEQAALDSLMTVLADGGADAAKVLVKGAVINGAKAVSNAWRDIFSEDPESYPLANRVASNPDDTSAQEELKALVKELLEQRPELVEQVRQTITTGDIRADKGSVAVGVMSGSTVNITNK